MIGGRLFQVKVFFANAQRSLTNAQPTVTCEDIRLVLRVGISILRIVESTTEQACIRVGSPDQICRDAKLTLRLLPGNARFSRAIVPGYALDASTVTVEGPVSYGPQWAPAE